MTAGRKKEQFMALVEPNHLGDLDALRVVGWTSRAEILRIILGRYLRVLKAENKPALDRLDAVAARVEVKRAEFVSALVAGRQRVPSLEELEEMDEETLLALLKA